MQWLDASHISEQLVLRIWLAVFHKSTPNQSSPTRYLGS